MNWRAVAALELRSLWRRRLSWVVALTLFVVGGLAIAHGASRLAREEISLAANEAALREQVGYLKQVVAPQDDLGLLLYYLEMPVAQQPTPWSPLATGLRGIHPANRQLRLTGLVPQLYQTEIDNPMAEHAGRFDLAFVLVFLLPLLVIALGYDVASREKELGTESLLTAQPVLLSRVVLLRLGLRMGWLAFPTLLLVAAFLVASAVPLDLRTLLLPLATIAYLLFWVLVVSLVVSRGRTSAFNAISLVGTWLGLCVLLPAVLHVATAVTVPLRGGEELTLAQRLDMNSRWDRAKADTMEPFFERHPEWAGVQVPRDQFSWPWYYAMHETGDEHVATQTQQYHASLQQRTEWTAQSALLLPPLAFELFLERLAGNDFATSLAYRESISDYHVHLKHTAYSWIFRFQGLSAFSLDALPRHQFSAEGVPPVSPGQRGLAGFAMLSLLLVPLALRKLDLPRPRRLRNRRIEATPGTNEISGAGGEGPQGLNAPVAGA